MCVSAVILAGGASRRMGRDKAWMEIGGRSLLQIARDKARALGVAEIFISGRPGVDYSALGCPVLLDLEPDAGPLGGVERGLQACSAPLLLVLAVDLPCLTADFLGRLLAGCDYLTGAVPKPGGRLQPLAAIYPRRCHALALDALVNCRRSASAFAEACLRERAVRLVRVKSADEALFANWNSPDDCRQAPQITDNRNEQFHG